MAKKSADVVAAVSKAAPPEIADELPGPPIDHKTRAERCLSGRTAEPWNVRTLSWQS